MIPAGPAHLYESSSDGGRRGRVRIHRLNGRVSTAVESAEPPSSVAGGQTVTVTSNVDALPALDAPYALGESERAAYARDGHVLLRRLASEAEVAPYRDAIAGAVKRHSTETRPIAERDTYGKAFLQVMNLWRHDEAVRRFVMARCFARVAAELMGVRGVRLYHDQALYKEPGGGPTPWHQDQHYWPLETDRTITMWMPLVPASELTGTMSFASGSNASGYLGDLPISDRSDEELSRLVKERGFRVVAGGAMAAGDATFHSGWTLHAAPGNRSDAPREVMTIIYFADGVRVASADNAGRQNDLRSWLPGLAPGELAASELNPLLYAAP